MVGEDRVLMSVKELRRLPVIQQALEKKLTQKQAGELLGLTVRQVRRLIQRVRHEGARGGRIGDGGSRRTGGSRRRSKPRG